MSINITQARQASPSRTRVGIEISIPYDDVDSGAVEAALDALEEAAQAASAQLNAIYAGLRIDELGKEGASFH